MPDQGLDHADVGSTFQQMSGEAVPRRVDRDPCAQARGGAEREHLDPAVVVALVRDIAAADALEFRNQYPAYAADQAGETRKALDALRADPLHRRRYTRFMADMVYGEPPEFDEAFATAAGLDGVAW